MNNLPLRQNKTRHINLPPGYRNEATLLYNCQTWNLSESQRKIIKVCQRKTEIFSGTKWPFIQCNFKVMHNVLKRYLWNLEVSHEHETIILLIKTMYYLFQNSVHYHEKTDMESTNNHTKFPDVCRMLI